MVGRLLVTGPLTGPETGIERAAFRTGGARLRASRSQGSTRRGNEESDQDQRQRRASSASFSIAPIRPWDDHSSRIEPRSSHFWGDVEIVG